MNLHIKRLSLITAMTASMITSSIVLSGCAKESSTEANSDANLSESAQTEMVRLESLRTSAKQSNVSSTVDDPKVNQKLLKFAAENKKNHEAFDQLLILKPELSRLLPRNEQGQTIDKSVSVGFQSNDGKIKQRILMGADSIKEEIGHNYLKSQDPVNLNKLYAKLYNAIPKRLQGKYTNPKDLSGVANIDQLQNSIKSLFSKSGPFLPNLENLPNPNLDGMTNTLELKTHDCSAELGYEMGSDLDISVEPAYNSNGIMKNFAFKLRNKMSCVRDQGQRGSCSAFAVLAAFETYAAQKYSPLFVNLSEQELYWFAETKYQVNFEEGLNTNQLLNQIEDYYFSPQPEFNWNYNQSLLRTGADTNTDFADVCDGYTIASYLWGKSGEMCTETVGQGETRRLSSGGWAVDEPSETTTQYMAENVVSLWNILDVDTSLESAKTLLKAGTPLVYSLSVPKPMPNRSLSAGYLDYATYSGNDSAGGHSVLMIGWISNDQMSKISGVSGGSGGGYFVIRNSWGWSSGDHGYLYLPYDFIKEFGTGLATFDPSGLLK